jgi:hypothetical protein
MQRSVVLGNQREECEKSQLSLRMLRVTAQLPLIAFLHLTRTIFRIRMVCLKATTTVRPWRSCFCFNFVFAISSLFPNRARNTQHKHFFFVCVHTEKEGGRGGEGGEGGPSQQAHTRQKKSSRPQETTFKINKRKRQSASGWEVEATFDILTRIAAAQTAPLARKHRIFR